jgi:AraC family transcriptional activator of mtrCDE
MSSHTETIADWLLSGLELKSTIFHVGQYCGAWQASTAGRHRASFHLALHGESWLHLPANAERAAQSVRLAPGDAVFLLHDMPHCLSPDPHPPASGHETERIGTMSQLTSPDDARAPAGGSVGIACGFFEFNSGLDDMLLSLLPDYIVARRDNPSLDGARAIFDLIRAEALRDVHTPSPLIARLTDLLFVVDAPPGICPARRGDRRSARRTLDHRHDGELRPHVEGALLQAVCRYLGPATRPVCHARAHENGGGHAT